MATTPADRDYKSYDEQAQARKSLVPSLTVRQDFEGGNFPIYIGEAPPGTATSEAKWRIRKITYSGTQQTAIEWADGVGTFSKVWDDRTSYSYS